MRAEIHIIDEQNADFFGAIRLELSQQIFGDLITSFGKYFAGGHINNIFSGKPAEKIRIANKNRLHTSFSQLIQRPRGHFCTSAGNDFFGFRINQITDQLAAFQ